MSFSPDWIQALSSIVTTAVGIIALIFAIRQISQITAQLKMSTLNNVLSLEAEINLRKEKLDNVNYEIKMLSKENRLDNETKEIYENKQEMLIENWLNSIERFCFCIKRNFFKEKDWKLEYRDYIKEIIQSFEYKFGAGTKYNNIIELNKKWSSE
jgi:ABC-type antimicrobial peptide transport system permease subunit